jgi:glycosyltransferase involved in cell wall biosynthesis
MLRQLNERPRKVLMTVDAVGGVWRYAMDVGAALAGQGIETLFVGLGPRPTAQQRAEADHVGRLDWLDLPLDWLVEEPSGLDALPDELLRLVDRHGIELVHLNLPTQAAGLDLPVPLVVASHSCVVSWFRAVRGTDLPAGWAWQRERNARGLARADVVMAPSRSHAALLEACYGPIPTLTIIPNATVHRSGHWSKDPFVLAAGRWWDEGKNGAVLDAAAGWLDWPLLMAGSVSGPNGQSVTLTQARALGALPCARLAAVVSRAALVASPSIYEPFGLFVLEAASAGAALVLSDIPTYRELWADAAVFVPPRDAAAWTEALNELARLPGRRADLGQSAQHRSRRFTLAAQSDALLSAYASAMSRFAHPKLVA